LREVTAAGAAAMLRVRGLAMSYGGERARRLLAGVDLELARGDYVAIMGESGSGKSTLLNLIAGLDLPQAGSITFDGVELTRLDDDARTLLRRDRIGFVFQAFLLLPRLTVLQNVALPLALAGAGDAAARARAMLERVGLAAAAHAYPHELSGGEAQRAAIARALVHRPALVLADEPTGNLDQENAAQVLALLREAIRDGGGAGILVTHSAAAAASADRGYRLEAGRLHPLAPAGEHDAPCR
jgi:putative ABC transport system ATP-binding protein